MKNLFSISFLFIWLFYLTSCNKQKAESITNPASSAGSMAVEQRNADSIEQLHSILLQALKTKDKQLYISYCFTQAQEEKMAQLLLDPKKKKYFLREFGFSLHEELSYFENIGKYIVKTGIDLNLVEVPLIEVIDYNQSNYSPIVLKEVIIPIIQEGIERDVVYVAIQIDGKWYFTSELSL